MDKKEALELFSKTGVIISGSHFIYSSGRHGRDYVDKTAILAHPRTTIDFCFEIAKHFSKSRVDIVLGPAVGGAILSQGVALALVGIQHNDVLSFFADKAEEGFVIKRGFRKLIYKKNVLLVDDVFHTGQSIEKVAKEVRECDGKIIGVGVLFNRGAKKPIISNFFSYIDLIMESFDESNCPMCAQNIPINKDFGRG